MRNSFKTILTIAVVFASAISILRLMQAAPPKDIINDPQDLAYKAYMLNHSLMNSIFIVMNMLVWLSGYSNRAIRSCIVLNLCIFGYMVFKVFYLDLSQNQMIDNTALGVSFLIALLYLAKNQTKGFVLFLKEMLKHTKSKWPNRTKQKHGLPE